MASITLKYDDRNPLIKSIINSAILAGAEVEEKSDSPYNKEFVKKIRRSEKQPGVKVDLDNLWK
jgi:hypothetical protein